MRTARILPRRLACLLAAALLTAPGVPAAGGEESSGGAETETTSRNRTFVLFHATEGDPAHLSHLKSGEEGLILSSPDKLVSQQFFKIRPDAEYVMTLTVTNKGKRGLSLYAGAAPYGVWLSNVARVPGTETELLRDVKKGDRVIRVRSVEKWKTEGVNAAFLAERDGSDLPNRNLRGVESFSADAETGEGEVRLAELGAPCDAPAGSLVRLQYCRGSTYNWAGSIWLNPGKEITWSVRMKGVGENKTPGEHKFWPGARDFRWVIAPVGGAVTPETPLVFKEIKLVRILPPEP